MIERSLAHVLQQRLKLFPAVALVGPRQCGKTTLARTLARRYFNLEDPDERTRLDALWPDAIQDDGPIVFDEAQNWPDLFSRLRGAIDAQRKKNGRYILLGSVSPSLMRNVSESLASSSSKSSPPGARAVKSSTPGSSAATTDTKPTSFSVSAASAKSSRSNSPPGRRLKTSRGWARLRRWSRPRARCCCAGSGSR